MKTNELRDEHGNLCAFEVRSDLLSIRTIENLFLGLDGVTELKTPKLFLGMFNWSTDNRIEFKFRSIAYVVSEPYGDSSMYWIGPKDLTKDNRSQFSDGTLQIQQVFLDFKISPKVKFLCDLATLNFKEIFRP
jgi:hypothetical protein